jgi:type II secretory pathway pseudopilin PulG
MKKNLTSYILHPTSRKGYTIVELLAVAGILVVLSGIILGIIYSTIRGSSKTQLTTQVSQNGRYSVAVLEGIISDSRNITQIDGVDIDDCTSNPSGTNSITLARLDGGITILTCGAIGGIYTIASNGASLLDTRNVKSSFCNFSCSQVVSDPYSVPIVNVSYKIVGLFQLYSSAGFTASASSSLRVYSP